jgi:hypothetical protein
MKDITSRNTRQEKNNKTPVELDSVAFMGVPFLCGDLPRTHISARLGVNSQADKIARLAILLESLPGAWWYKSKVAHYE